jgi:hypothetical protein
MLWAQTSAAAVQLLQAATGVKCEALSRNRTQHNRDASHWVRAHALIAEW